MVRPGNNFMPSTTEFVADLFGDKAERTAISASSWSPGEQGSFKMQPHDVAVGETPTTVFLSGDLPATAVKVVHGAGSGPRLARRSRRQSHRLQRRHQRRWRGAHAAGCERRPVHRAQRRAGRGDRARETAPHAALGHRPDRSRTRASRVSSCHTACCGRWAKRPKRNPKSESPTPAPSRFANDLDCFPLR